MEYLDTDDICKMFKITRKTVERWRAIGLPSIKLGRIIRFEKQAVSDWVNKQK